MPCLQNVKNTLEKCLFSSICPRLGVSVRKAQLVGHQPQQTRRLLQPPSQASQPGPSWGHWDGFLLLAANFKIFTLYLTRELQAGKKKNFFKPRASVSPFVQPYFSHLHQRLPEESSLLYHETIFHQGPGTGGMRAHSNLPATLGSQLLLQETTFSEHIVIYGAHSWVFTLRLPCWQVAAEPNTSDGLKPLPISCLNAFRASLYLCSCAKVLA